MGGLLWAAEHLFDILSTVVALGGLFFAAITIREDTKTRKISNLLAMTANHREVWENFFERPDLARVLQPSVEIKRKPITADEEVFVTLVILHLSTVFEALKDELLIKQEGLRRDAGSFFALPIPQAVWSKIKSVQNHDFVRFVEECRRNAVL